MRYAKGTYLEQANGRFTIGSALCSDGKVRALRFGNGLADTFFSVPASVQVKGKTVSGFVCVETLEGFDTPTDSDPAVVKFIAYAYGRNAKALPRGSFRMQLSEADKVRRALFNDPTVSNTDYGRLVEEAAQSDEARALELEAEGLFEE